MLIELSDLSAADLVAVREAMQGNSMASSGAADDVESEAVNA
jgi:hypothetical protein